MSRRPWLAWPLRFALSSLFIYAGWAKLRDPNAFGESIASFRLLPAFAISPAALTIPPLEILAGVCALLVGRVRRIGSFCLLSLLVAFILAIASALARGLTVDCGCFGADGFDISSPAKNLWFALARDLVLLVVARSLYAASRRVPSGDSTG